MVRQFFLSPFWRASLFLSAMIMGVGMYGIPYVISRVGFFFGIVELLVLTAVTVLIHLLYGEIVLRTKEWHRLPGYANIYLGPAARKIATISYLISFSGALGAYVLLGGQFLSNVFGGMPVEWSYLFLLLGAAVLFFGLGFQARIDMATVTLLTLLIVGISVYSFPHINPANFTSINISEWFLPYGVIMFALAGMAAVPDMVGILEHNPRLLRRAIVTGTLIPATLYVLFAFAVVGVSGMATTEEAIAGITRFLGTPAGIAASLVGVFSTFGSFIALGSVLKAMFHLDLKYGWKASWFLVILIPWLFLSAGFKSYLPIIGFLGGVCIAVDGLMTLLIYRKALKRGDRHAEYSLHIPVPYLLVLALLYLVGVAHSLIF